MNLFTKILVSGVLCSSSCMSMNGFANAEDSIGDFVNEVPGIGLIADSIHFDGITISNFEFENSHRYTFVHPDETFSAKMHYALNADALSTLHLHHFIVGLYDDGPQMCIIHSLGIRDAEGNVQVTLKAPAKKGVYQVRFCHAQGITDQEAHKAWWRGEGPSVQTIVGIVVVK